MSSEPNGFRFTSPLTHHIARVARKAISSFTGRLDRHAVSDSVITQRACEVRRSVSSCPGVSRVSVDSSGYSLGASQQLQVEIDIIDGYLDTYKPVLDLIDKLSFLQDIQGFSAPQDTSQLDATDSAQAKNLRDHVREVSYVASESHVCEAKADESDDVVDKDVSVDSSDDETQSVSKHHQLYTCALLERCWHLGGTLFSSYNLTTRYRGIECTLADTPFAECDVPIHILYEVWGVSKRNPQWQP